MLRFALALAFALFASVAPAQERLLPPDRVAGTDGIITQCVSFTRVAFANQMCDVAIGEIATIMERLGIAHLHLGRTEWGFGVDRYLWPEGETGMDAPLHLTLYIRGTDVPPAATLWASLYLDMNEAGRLVVWEDHGIGADSVIQAGSPRNWASGSRPRSGLCCKSWPRPGDSRTRASPRHMRCPRCNLSRERAAARR
ncbi:MAG: hypothetical protein AAGP08_02195 [Pseudomonadota bacterium]